MMLLDWRAIHMRVERKQCRQGSCAYAIPIVYSFSCNLFGKALVKLQIYLCAHKRLSALGFSPLNGARCAIACRL